MERGAIPEVRLAELDSATHHIREQNDLDRRAQALRNRGFAERFDRLEDGHHEIRLELSRVSDTCLRTERVQEAHTETQAKILEYISQQRGAIRVLTGLLVAVGLPVAGYAAKLLLGH